MASETSLRQITAVSGKNKAISLQTKYYGNTTGISFHAIIAGERRDATRFSSCLSLLKSLVYAQDVCLTKFQPVFGESDCLIRWYAEHIVQIRTFS